MNCLKKEIKKAIPFTTATINKTKEGEKKNTKNKNPTLE